MGVRLMFTEGLHQLYDWPLTGFDNCHGSHGFHNTVNTLLLHSFNLSLKKTQLFEYIWMKL